MNILYILQQSIYNNDGRWLTGDSNVQMMRGILTELLEKTDWNFYILIGKLEDFADIKSYDEILKHERVHFISYNFPVNAFLNRQHFDTNEFSKVLDQIPKENLIVWNNITELSRNIKTLLFIKKIPHKLITCCYWMDTPEIGEPKVDESISYQFRQFDGYECSDLCVFTCQSTKEAFFDNAQWKFKIPSVQNIRTKSTIWDFGFSSKELEKYHFPEFRNYEKIILFLNRMSETNYTHHLEFIKAINELWEERQDFTVAFTNPSQKISKEWLRKNVKAPVLLWKHSLNREQYSRLLWDGKVSFHGYTSERYGGVAHRESLYCRNIVVTPKLFEYERIQGDDYKFYVKKDFSNLMEVFNKALDFSSVQFDDSIFERNNQSSFEVISDKVIKDIEELCNK